MSAEKHTLDELRIDRSAAEKTPSRSGILAAILTVIVVVVLLGWWLKRPPAVEVQTFTVRESAGANGGQRTVLNASGYVVARREATVSSKVTGKVIEVLIEEGMKVKAGEVLARLDSSNVSASLRLAEAQLDAAKSALAEIKVRLDEAQREWRRTTDLAANKIATQSDLDRTEAEVKSFKARLDKQQVEVTVAERQVSLWQQQMEDMVVRAPFAGVVTAKNAQPGEMISPMSAGGFTRTGICTVVDMESLEIEIDVSESYINRVVPGQPVAGKLDAHPDWIIPCKVIAIIPTADRQKATVKVRVGFDQLDPRILPQMGVKVAFQETEKAPSKERGLVLPKSAIRREDGRDVVFVVHNGQVERRAITLGDTRNDEATVTAGLTAGEKVVVKGPDNLAAGTRIKENP